jgi:enediyne biosynthesis protein E5
MSNGVNIPVEADAACVGTAPKLAASATTPKKAGRFARFKPFLAPILITIILAVGNVYFGLLEGMNYSRELETHLGAGAVLDLLLTGSIGPVRFIENYIGIGTAVAIVSSIFLEIILGKIATGRVPPLASAYITGISVGILVRAPLLWPFIVCSWLSISSKYILRYKDRHLWNPSNLGVSILLFLAPYDFAPLSLQWGNEMWPGLIIMFFGCAILFTLGRLHVTLTYMIAFSILSFFRCEWTGSKWINEIGLLTVPSYELFMFFMITDPKTTPRTTGRRIVVTIIVAVVETILRLNREIHAPYYALFIVFPVTNLIEIWWDGRKAAPSAAPVVAASSSCGVPAANVVRAGSVSDGCPDGCPDENRR